MSTNILVLAVGDPQQTASTIFRVAQYGQAWAKQGVDLHYIQRPSISRDILAQVRSADVVLNQKCVLNTSLSKAIRQASRRLIFDFDDAVWTRPGSDFSWFTRWRVSSRLRWWMRESDVVSVHSNLTPEKYHMIRAEHLALMKPSAYFVNVARGALVDQAALVKVLQERRIAGAGLDVFEVEPLPADDPLTELDNVLLTPHWTPATSDIWTAGGLQMSQCILKVARGEVPPNVINRSVLESPHFQAKLARFAENQEVGSL